MSAAFIQPPGVIIGCVLAGFSVVLIGLIVWAVFGSKRYNTKLVSAGNKVAHAAIVPRLHIRVDNASDRLDVRLVNYGLGPAQVSGMQITYPKPTPSYLTHDLAVAEHRDPVLSSKAAVTGQPFYLVTGLSECTDHNVDIDMDPYILGSLLPHTAEPDAQGRLLSAAPKPGCSPEAWQAARRVIMMNLHSFTVTVHYKDALGVEVGPLQQALMFKEVFDQPCDQPVAPLRMSATVATIAATPASAVALAAEQQLLAQQQQQQLGQQMQRRLMEQQMEYMKQQQELLLAHSSAALSTPGRTPAVGPTTPQLSASSAAACRLPAPATARAILRDAPISPISPRPAVVDDAVAVRLEALQDRLAAMQRGMEQQQQQVVQAVMRLSTLQAQQMAPLSQTPGITVAQALLAQQLAGGGGMASAAAAQSQLPLQSSTEPQPFIDSQYVPVSRLGSEVLSESGDADKLIERMQSSAREAVDLAREGLASLDASPTPSLHDAGAPSVRTVSSAPNSRSTTTPGGNGLRALIMGSTTSSRSLSAGGTGLQPLSPSASQGNLSDGSMSI